MEPSDTAPRRQSDGLDPQDVVHMSFAGVEAANSTEFHSSHPSSIGYSGIQPFDFSRIDCDSTYSALSSCLRILRQAGNRDADSVSRTELDLMIQEFENRSVDLSDVIGFPYEAKDLGDCTMLLARLQNRLAMQGIRYASCTLGEMMEDTLIDRSNKKHRYDIGEWIEVRGPSMKYRLERIKDVIRANADEEDGDHFIYETAVDHKLTEDLMRWPRQALRRIFGMSPWVWRQWACLKIENKMRFEEGHPEDFELIDIRAYALELWELWLADKRNWEFRKLFERVGTSGQEELLHHLMSPFNLMREVIANSTDRWDVKDAEVSMFTYLSLLGTGFLSAFVVFWLQCFIPCVLFLYYTSPAREENEIQAGTREMLFAVLVYYLYKLNQDLWTSFNHVAGNSQNTSSRIRSLRRITWDEGNDNFFQSVGYTVDLFMNSGYVCLLYLFNIWILYNVSDPFELLGSVIFFEFLFDLDEEIAQASWWDRKKRYLKAGIVSSIIQNTIRRSIFADAETYVKKMGATLTKSELELVKRRFEEAGLPTDRDFVHGPESDEGHLLTVAERVDRLRRIESKATLPDEYDEEAATTVYDSIACKRQKCMFQRHEDLRAWSQLEVLLFAFPTPSIVPPDYLPGTRLLVPEDIAEDSPLKNKRLVAPGKTSREHFLRHTLDVISCRYTSRNFRSGSEKDTDWFQFTRLLHAVAAWTSYFLQLTFPVFSLVAVVLVYSDYYCSLHLGECIFAVSVLQSRRDDSDL